jgi:hypothetical protein
MVYIYIYKGRGLVIIYRSNRLLHLAPAKTLGWPERKRERERERERVLGPRAIQKGGGFAPHLFGW